MEQRLAVESSPSGAEVFLDGERLGPAPVLATMPAAGSRRVVLRLAGRTPVEHWLALRPPWYLLFPFDLLGNLVAAGSIVEASCQAPLPEAREPDLEALRTRAEAMRAEGLR